ncbi:hypothetical protein CHLNCDRAFT_142355 [Chlorella variabilis]|uniref:Peptidase C1A papain C-terminal domain-containing protein n=1 Tax=Chlorella variabilis TaxID=554065 RepID=E1Z8C9_CHLVA|nr:hypothetical protein CHLNCDRAFT_142355 [Chlorella variabilis]EFN58071.1 hypothetical protein CHLNCDRAFT_142355 [Chlorella variabilis]|eukprot:XP_005850173.1 hypothetical protein CHLNCDRAFT_142355 [Chlorella variabilis]
MRPALLTLLALACAWHSAQSVDDIEPKRPVWPSEYQISWDFTVPYIDEYQKSKDGFKYQYQAWQDTRLGRQKVVRNGKETVILLVPVNKMYEVFPAYDHLTCWEDEIHGGTGPTLAGAQQGGQAVEEGQEEGQAAAGEAPRSQQRRRLRGEAEAAAEEEGEGRQAGGPYLFDWEKKPAKLLHFLLPDLSEERWQYVGTEVFKDTGDSARVYEWDLTAGGVSDMRYRFYVTRDGVPLRLWMMGTNLGYGTSEAGELYWLVKNIWSPYWGEKGYMRVARSPNDCGVASEPLYLDLTV